MDKFDTLFYKIAVLILFLITLLLNINIEILKKEMRELKSEVTTYRTEQIKEDLGLEFGPYLPNLNFSLNLNENSSE